MVTRRGYDFFKRTEPKAELVTRSVSEEELNSVFASLTRRVSNKVTASTRERGGAGFCAILAYTSGCRFSHSLDASAGRS